GAQMRRLSVLFMPLLLLSFSAVAHATTQSVEKNGLVLWLKADDGLAKDGSRWADRSGSGHDATALPGRAPYYMADAINGLPAAQFVGGQAMRIDGAVLDSQTFTIIAVVNDASQQTE